MDNNYIHRDIETVISEAAKYFHDLQLHLTGHPLIVVSEAAKYFHDLQSDIYKGIAKGK